MSAFSWAVAVLSCFGAVAVAMDVPEFFPKIDGDLTKVTWAHAVNSRALLQAALSSDVMMLEGDVSLGSVVREGNLKSEDVPIMAHPPSNTSDLSLEEFLTRLIAEDKKGIKLDFKSTEVFVKSVDLLHKHNDAMKFPVWLNADILPGPVNSTATPVDADTFLNHCRDHFPNRTLSVGWTTNYGGAITEGQYLQNQTAAMRETLERLNITQAVTFPVRAGLAARSTSVLLSLLEAVPHSTLTVWGPATDEVDHELLRQLITQAGNRRVYRDLPGFSIDLHDGGGGGNGGSKGRGLPFLLGAALAAAGLALIGRINNP